MTDFVWDQDVRAVLASLLGAGQQDNQDVDTNVALAVKYAQALSKQRAAQQTVERGPRKR